MEAEFVGANETSTADLSEAETIDTSVDTEVDSEVETETETEGNETESASVVTETEEVEQTEQSAEENAKYAAARRQAEAEYAKKQSALDAEAKRLFGTYKHPDTGKPIESWAEYASAIEAQQRNQRNKELEEKGISPQMIDDMIQNSPTMRQAKDIIAQQQKAEADRALADDLKAISKYDPDIKTLDDVLKGEHAEKVIDYVKNNGLSLVDAYRLAYSDKLQNKSTAAAKQAAINSAKSTNHLETTRGVKTGGDDMTPIPESALNTWKTAYPNLSMKELTAKYNAVL